MERKMNQMTTGQRMFQVEVFVDVRKNKIIYTMKNDIAKIKRVVPHGAQAWGTTIASASGQLVGIIELAEISYHEAIAAAKSIVNSAMDDRENV
jgi:hypothetical protein